MKTEDLKAPPPTMDDRKAAMLLVRLAEINREEAVARLVPVCTAARLWAEGQAHTKKEGPSDES